MNETNPTHFLLQRYLENISASRTAMNSLFYSMLNSISEQERNMSELLYHYISSTQTQNNNIALDIQNQQSTNHMNVARQNTPTFSDTSGYFINPNRVSTIFTHQRNCQIRNIFFKVINKILVINSFEANSLIM